MPLSGRSGEMGSADGYDQAPIRLREDTLPWPGEEHRAVGDTVRAVEPVDGAPTFADECRRGASVMREMAGAGCSRRL